MKRARGFTLIELMVAIAIIAVLALIIIASLLQAEYKARDAARLADLRTIAQVLEFYNTQTGHYPISTNWVTGCDHLGSNWIPDGANYNWATPFIASMPRDVSENCSSPNPHTFSYWSDGTSYKITTQLESPNPPSNNGTEVFSSDTFSAQPVAADTSPITVTLSSPAANPTNASPIPVMVSFSRGVVDFVQSDVSVVSGFVSNFFAVLTSAYDLFVTPTDNNSVIVSIQGNVVHDANGVGNLPAQFTITYDSLLPHPALSPAPLPASVSGPFTVSVNFTVGVVGFSTSDVSASNATISNLVQTAPGDGTNFTFTVTPTASGAVTISIPQGAVDSDAGNSNIASNALNTTFTP
jgi:prepilin-type N-terminal cleavage/methylation domain-containing protein